jgi:IS1 family transposase
MNKLPIAKRAAILGMLAEGMSLRATSRLADVSINTVTKLQVEAGAACQAYQDEHLRDLTSRRIQCDEIWSFVYAKDRNLPSDKWNTFGFGSVWTWTAIDADSKLIISWLVGTRDADSATILMRDLASRLRYRVQLTSDGHRAYLTAVDDAFGSEIDFSQLIKIYGNPTEVDSRYTPGECIGCKQERIIGKPNPLHVSTSFVERQNLTMRMSIRRFTRLTNAFSKKVENHAAAVALHFMHYNYARIHKTLRVTPAMAAGVTDHVWSMEEIVEMIDRAAPKPAPRGPYNKPGTSTKNC